VTAPDRIAVIVGAARTPVGRLRGGLSPIRADDLAALPLGELVRRHQIPADELDEVILGCANQAGEDNRNVARMALLIAGLPETVPAVTVNRLCGSGAEAVLQAARAIAAGEGSLYLAGGVESMSRAPWAMQKPASGLPSGPPAIFDTALGWRFPNPKLEARFPLETMGETAENLAEEFSISRDEQDRFALVSHTRALAAEAAGHFADERFAVEVAAADRGKTTTVAIDEGPRADTTLDKLGKLGAAFRKGGTVSAGNSSTLNDGAAALLVCSAARAAQMGWPVLARLAGGATAGVSPRRMGIGPVPATQKALAKAGWSLGDVDRVELNEAFAAQALAVLRELPFHPSIVNVNGGGIALGHPLGMSGARLCGTLAYELRRSGKRRGIVTMCIGVGQGITVLLERD